MPQNVKWIDEVWTLYWDYIRPTQGVYVCTIAKWLREHPHCDVGHQFLPSDHFGGNMLYQQVHSKSDLKLGFERNIYSSTVLISKEQDLGETLR
jgi:hypothetical protein